MCLKLAGHDVWSGIMIDIGCGLGYLSKHFLDAGIAEIGLDISRDLLKVAHEVAPSGNFILASGVILPFKGRCFTTAVLNDVLEHVPYSQAPRLLAEAKRILKSDGRLYVSVTNKYQIVEPHTLIPFLSWLPKLFWAALCRLSGKPQYIPWGPVIYPYTVKRLTILCHEAGLNFEDYTWFYSWNKISNTDNIGNPNLRSLAKTIKRLKLSKLAYRVAEKVSVILFICQKS